MVLYFFLETYNIFGINNSLMVDAVAGRRSQDGEKSPLLADEEAIKEVSKSLIVGANVTLMESSL